MKSELISRGFLTESEVGKYHKIGYVPKETVRRKNSSIYCLDDYQQNIGYIVDQYIKNSGTFVINISYKNRKLICEQIDYSRSSVDVEFDGYRSQSLQTKKKQKSCTNISGKSSKIETEMIQISSTTKSMEERMFGNRKDIIIRQLLLLDEVVHEILMLLSSDTFPRFALTAQYTKLLQL